MELDVVTKNQDNYVKDLVKMFSELVLRKENKEVSILAGEFCMHYDFYSRMLYFGNILSEF